MADSIQAIKTADYFGSDCRRVWTCRSLPMYTPFAVTLCHPCTTAVEWEVAQESKYNGNNTICPSTGGGCVVCCVSMSLGGFGDICLQGYISSVIARGSSKTDGGSFIKYTIWNCLWPCTCGPCITFEASHAMRANNNATLGNIEPLM